MIEHGDLRLYYEASDQMTTAAAASAAVSGTPVTCKVGCSACCYMQIHISSSEALGLAVFIMDHPTLRANLTKYVENVIQLWSKPSLVKRFKDKPPRPSQQQDIHWGFQIPCPLLTADDMCAAYDLRPLRCRAHQVCSPPENCAPGGKSDQIAMLRPSRENRRQVEDQMRMTLLYDRFVSIEEAYVNESHGLLGALVLRAVEALERRTENTEPTEHTVVGGPADDEDDYVRSPSDEC
jgi:hypothetical protein